MGDIHILMAGYVREVWSILPWGYRKSSSKPLTVRKRGVDCAAIEVAEEVPELDSSDSKSRLRAD
jgi:hypothetical protein